MRKRQKLILIVYVYAVLFIGFLYVPYVRYYPNGSKRFIGHHIKPKLLSFIWGPGEASLWGNIAIDSNLIIAELIAITALTVVAFILLKRE
jgi:hypothetical protein